MTTIDTEKKILRRMSLLYIEGTMRENLLTIVEQIVCQRQLEQQEDEQDDGHRLGVF